MLLYVLLATGFFHFSLDSHKELFINNFFDYP